MLRLEPLDPEALMDLYLSQGLTVPMQVVVDLCKAETGQMVVDDEGTVYGAGGIHVVRDGVGLAWVVLSPKWLEHWKDITFAVLNNLPALNMKYRRIEAVVKCEFKAGHRWARFLGFELEAPRMSKWGDDGTDYALYARVN